MNRGVPDTGKKTLVMGIANLTPDSFSDGGKFLSPEEAVRYIRQLPRDGADIVDIGAESTRPGAEPLSAQLEWARLEPVLNDLRELEIPISIDTYHAETARRALDLGAAIINDISALRLDPALPEVVASADCYYVLMHMQGTPQTMQRAPQYDEVIADICAFFEERLNFAIHTGIKEDRIWLDPGFGFGKTVQHNLEILRRLAEFKKFGRPLLIGASNKGTIGAILGTTVRERTEGNAAAVAVAIAHGADAVRVHEVSAMARVARMADAVVRGYR